MKLYLLMLEGRDWVTGKPHVERVGVFVDWDAMVVQCEDLAKTRNFTNYLVLESESGQALDAAYIRLSRGESLASVFDSGPDLIGSLRTTTPPPNSPSHYAKNDPSLLYSTPYVPEEGSEEHKRWTFYREMTRQGVFNEGIEEREVAD